MDRAELIEKIKAAFSDVALEDGIGILEADAIDSYASDQTRELARSKDFRSNWHDISDDVIAEHYAALCFMDAKGLRFNLPAYMIFALNNYATTSSPSVDAVIYALGKEPEYVEAEWTIFSSEQREAIAGFLRFMVTEVGEDWVDSWQASLAYEKTWSTYDKA